MDARFKKAKRGFAQEKKELLKELQELKFHTGHSIIFWSGREDQMDQEQLDKYNARKAREKEIEARLEEITVG